MTTEMKKNYLHNLYNAITISNLNNLNLGVKVVKGKLKGKLKQTLLCTVVSQCPA